MVWHIPLNGSSSKISKTDRYLKNGEVVEAARRDGRPGVLRSQLTFTPEGHVHIRWGGSSPMRTQLHSFYASTTGLRTALGRVVWEKGCSFWQVSCVPSEGRGGCVVLAAEVR